jgi:arginyl-tRNA synthetase
MSKRRGDNVFLNELLDEIGVDAARWYLVSRGHDQAIEIDIDLAAEKTQKNPVYYVQYAHARVCSVFAQRLGLGSKVSDVASAISGLRTVTLEPLNGERELKLAQRLAEYPEVVATAARELAPHSVAFYLRELAGEFHSYYNAERILVDDEALRAARLALCAAVRQTLANGLSLLGVSAPEKM